MASPDSKRRRVLQELIRRKEEKNRVDFDSLLFDEQRAFIEDESTRKAALCTRRAGKTHGIVVYMLKTAFQNDFCTIPYICLTRRQGKRNVWGTILRLNRQLQLGGTPNLNELSFTLPNGSRIEIIGMDDPGEIEKMRGGHYPLSVIDEAQSFGQYIRSLVDDVLDPAASDTRGTIVMTGTPGMVCAGFFYEVTTKATPEAHAWSTHRWSVEQNPYHLACPKHKDHIPEIDSVEARRIRNRWAPDNPTFLREWKGQWVEDNDLRVYKYRSSINDVAGERPNSASSVVLGLDLGYEDSSGFCILSYNQQTGGVTILESFKEKHLIPSAMAAKVEKLREQWDFSKIVADTGGFGKGYVEEMRQRYAITVEAAQKTQKRGYIELLNGDLQSGALKLVRSKNLDLIDEMSSLQWETNEDGKSDYQKIDDRFDDHLCDAMLYGWRACKHFLNEFEEHAPDPWTAEGRRIREEREEEEAQAQYRRESGYRPGNEDEYRDESHYSWDLFQ